MESLSIQLQPFFQWLLRTTLQASLLICLILIFQTVLRSRLGARWHNCLWLLLLIRLAIPWAPQSHLSIFNLIPQSITQQQTEYVRQEITYDTAVSEPASPTATEPEPASTIIVQQDNSKAIITAARPYKETKGRSKAVFSGLADIFPLIWLTGALVLGVYVTAGNFRLWRLVTRERPLTDQSILDLLEDCKSQMGIRTILGVVITDKVESPALFGFVRPRLLLPKGVIETLSREELSYVFLHELAHLKRHDIYIGYLASLLQVLHWFNPLIWLAFYRIRIDRELACDALVLARMHSDESKDYGRTIVSLLERFSLSQRLPAMAGILETKAQLKRRIKMIAKFKKNSYQLSSLSVTMIIILACICLPDAIRTRALGTSDAGLAPHISLRRVWSGPDVDAYGKVSSDGQYLSYTDWETGDLAVRELKTGKTQRLTEMKKGGQQKSFRFALNSVISPDGKLVAYSWTNQHGSYDLCVIGTDGSGDRTLYSSKDHELYPACWSSDGKQIAARKFTSKGGNLEIISVSVADGSVQVLKTSEEPFWPHFCYSPNGQYLVFDLPAEGKSENYDISLILTNGKGEIPLIKHPAQDRLLGWAPNHEDVLFLSNRAGTYDIWAIKVVDNKPQGSPRPIARDVGQISPQGFTEAGSFYFSRYTRKFTTYIVPFDQDTGEIKDELKSPLLGSNFDAEWSPDGRYLAYVKEQTEAEGPGYYHRPLHIRNVKTGKERILASNFTVIAPRWSPDSQTILVTGYDRRKDGQLDYNGGIYKIDVQDGKATELVRFPAVEVWSRDIWTKSVSEWAASGNMFFYTNRCRIIRRGLESGQEKQLYQNDNLERVLRLSPDGKRLLISTRNRDDGTGSILIMPVSGGETTKLCKFQESQGGIPVPGSVNWTTDGNYILFAKSEKKGSMVWRISSGGGEPEVIWKSKDRVTDLSIQSNGEKIAVSTYLQEQSIWLMENFLPEKPVAKPAPMTTVRRVGYEWRGPFASLSPDGRYICDREWNTGSLVIHELATGKSRTLIGRDSHVADFPLVSAISPDSKKVAYLWHDPNKNASSLHLVGLEGAGHRVLCMGKWLTPRDWSWDGKKILAVVEENDIWQMVWISVSDGSLEHIASVGTSYPGKLDLSPDGRFIAYDCRRGEYPLKRDVFVFDLRENRELSVIKHPADDRFLGWTPDGKHVFFISDRTGTWDAWLLPVANGKPQGFPKLARHGIGNITPIGFTPQGSYYYGHEQTLEDVFVAKLDLETGEFLSEPMPVRQSGATGRHDWSPDGLYLAYCQRRGDRSQAIHIRTLATGRERTLATNIPYIRWLRWTPDMRFFLIDGYKRGDSQGVISKIDVKTGERSDIIQSTTEVLIRPEMSPDGKTLFYDRINPKSRTMRLIGRDMESGREKELFRVAIPAWLTGSALSPDGQRMVLSIVPRRTGTEGPVLKILSTSGGQPRELLQFEKSEKLRTVGVTWMPDSQNVLFWKWFQGDKELELWRISAEGSEPRKLCSRKAFGHLRVHPDGQRIAFYDRSTTRGIWVMENFLPRVVSKAKQSR